MARAYKEESGVDLIVLSAYRSEADQECVCRNVPRHCAGWRRITTGTDADGKPVFKMIKTGGHSRHLHRTAIDMRPGDADVRDHAALHESYKRFFAWLAKHQRKFGLCHPLFHIGDRAHIELRTHAHKHVRKKKHKKKHAKRRR